ncbi:MAG: hypothetical protein HZB16_05685 [Armatimonadetes bacterium]|nr:hypothetical protein [Armatimonadota bacterium]
MNHLVWMLASALAVTAGAEEAPSRIVVRDGQFIDEGTGRPFTPLGANYYRVGAVSSGKQGHSALCPPSYDRAYVERMMTDLEASGFNTLRVFHSFLMGEDGILASPEAREVAPGYAANLLHLLRTARSHHVRLIFTWDIWNPTSEWLAAQPLPDEARSGIPMTGTPGMLVNAFRFTLPGARTRAGCIVALIEVIKKADPGLLPVVLSWELENEVYYRVDQAPFDKREGRFTFAGRSYALDSDAELQALMDDNLVAWANLCAGAIRLVSAGVFSFAAVGRGGPGTLSADQTKDTRAPARLMALLRSGLDFLDLHLYAWRNKDQGFEHFLARNLASVEWEELRAAARKAGKPIFCGETGVFANYLRRAPNWQEIDHPLGLASFRDHLRAMSGNGFVGALYWHYGNPDTTPADEHPALALFPEYGKCLREAWQR